MAKATKSQRDAILERAAAIRKGNPKPKKAVAKSTGPSKSAMRQQAKLVAIKGKPVVGELFQDLDPALAVSYLATIVHK